MYKCQSTDYQFDQMPSGTPSVEFERSYSHAPSELAKSVFLSVLRGSHIKATPAYRAKAHASSGHDLVLCLDGRGSIGIGDRTFCVERGQLVWIDGRQPHACFADSKRPWELLWLQAGGPSMDTLAQALRIMESPVFDLPELHTARVHFDRILSLMERDSHSSEAFVHTELSGIIAALFEIRRPAVRWAPSLGLAAPAGVRQSVELLCVYYYRNWRVEDLARIAGMSLPHYFRCFQRATGSTPIGWLHRERISHAARLLVESEDSIKRIAGQVGYSDQFHFSRAFKRFTGASPSAFRRNERAGAACSVPSTAQGSSGRRSLDGDSTVGVCF